MADHTRARSRWSERLIAAAVVLVAGGAVVTLMLHNRRAAKEIANEIYVPRHTAMTPEIQMLQDYVRIDSSNPPGDEMPAVQWLASHLKSAGIAYEIIEAAPRRASLYARIKGRTPGEGLLLLNHTDVVPARGQSGWSHPPFSGAIAANMLHGRGALDMKSIGICQMEAFIAAAHSGQMPQRDLVFLAVADEETGGELGTDWILQHRPDIFEGIRYVLTEGGVTEMEQERVTYFGIEIGSKQVVDVTVVAPTREQLQRARIAIEPYLHQPDPGPISPGVRAFFHAVAPNRLEGRDLLTDIDKTVAAGKFWLIPPLNRELLQNTVWPFGIVSNGGQSSMRVIMADLPDEIPDRRIAWLAQAVKPYGAAIGTINRKDGPAPLSPHDTPMFSILAREAQRQLHPGRIGPEVLPISTTDCRFVRARGIVCYGFLPFPVDFFQSQTIHGPDERIRLDWFLAGVRTMASVVDSYTRGQ